MASFMVGGSCGLPVPRLVWGRHVTGYGRIPTGMGMPAAGAVYLLLPAARVVHSLRVALLSRSWCDRGVIESVMFDDTYRCI